jgi:hypothetical protein
MIPLTAMPLLVLLLPPQPPDAFVIHVDPPANGAALQVRYFITGAFGGVGGGERDATPVARGGISIPTSHDGKPAWDLKAVLYMPGCRMQVIRVDDLERQQPREAAFRCLPLATIPLYGRIDSSIIPAGDGAEVQVKYMALWADRLFGIEDGWMTTVPAGKAPVAPDGSFLIDLPDFSADPLSSGIARDAALMLFVTSLKTGSLLAYLTPPESLRTSANWLRVEHGYPAPVEFVVLQER